MADEVVDSRESAPLTAGLGDGEAAKGAEKPVAEAAEKPAAEAPLTEGLEGEKKPEGEGEKKPEGAPEKYEDFKVPEGLAIDAEQGAKFQGVARELNLSQAQAQKLVDFAVEREKATAEAHVARWGEVTKGWLAEARADKEIGGQKFDETIAYGQGALKKFGTPAFYATLRNLGLDNHPEFLRFVGRVGRELAPDGIVKGRAGAGQKSLAELIYPSANNTGKE